MALIRIRFKSGAGDKLVKIGKVTGMATATQRLQRAIIHLSRHVARDSIMIMPRIRRIPAGEMWTMSANVAGGQKTRTRVGSIEFRFPSIRAESSMCFSYST
jgi:hypothetical protein